MVDGGWSRFGWRGVTLVNPIRTLRTTEVMRDTCALCILMPAMPNTLACPPQSAQQALHRGVCTACASQLSLAPHGSHSTDTPYGPVAASSVAVL